MKLPRPLVALLAPAIMATQLPAQRGPATLESFGRLPLSFEANRGQAGEEVRYLSRTNDRHIYLTNSGAFIGVSYFSGTGTKNDEDLVKMELVGSTRQPEVSGTQELPGKVNYLIGNDPENWHTEIPTYGRVRYRGAYRGVDIVFYGNQRELEFDAVIAPGADPSGIRLRFQGSRGISLQPDGTLTIRTPHSSIAFRKPELYQDVDGKRIPVEGGFSLVGDQVSFRVGHYDSTRELVIDPTLVYSTYFGYGQVISDMAVDSAGEVCVTGSTNGSKIPVTPGVYQYNSAQGAPGYVSCLNAAGTQLRYSTYFGGTRSDYPVSIAMDAAGNVYLAGSTYSADFPVKAGSYLTTKPSSTSYYSGFVSKLGSNGTTLVWSTYLGGTGGDVISGAAIDSAGNAYVTGTTVSKDFPTKNAPQNTYKTFGVITGFVAAIGSTGATLIYSSYLGGSGGDYPAAVALDSTANAYVTGYTDSSDFPTTASAFQKTRIGGGACFVTKVPATGGTWTYSTLVSGTGYCQARAIAVDSRGQATFGGQAGGSDFPVTPLAFQKTNATYSNSQSTGFVAQLNPAGSKLTIGSYLGGSANSDQVNSVALDSNGQIYLTGRAYSKDFPVTSDALYPNARTGSADVGFVTVVSADGSSRVYSTYLGGSSEDKPAAIRLDSGGSIYVAGYTSSSDFPVTQGALEYTYSPPAPYSSLSEAFITKVSGLAATVTATPTFSPASGTYTSAQTVTISDATTGATIYYTTDGSTPTTSSTKYTSAITVSASTTINAIATATGHSNSSVATATYTIGGVTPAAATPTFSPVSGTYTSAQTVTISDATTGATIYYTTDGSTPTASSTKYTGAISVGASTTINAIATAAGYATSSVATATYTISGTTPTAATPTFSPASGTYSSTQTVAISDATSGATIYYTTNGTTPTTSSTKYTAPVTVNSTSTLSAIAVASGYNNSSVGTANYVINSGTPDFTVVLSASSLNIARGGSGTLTLTASPANGFSQSISLQCSGLPANTTCSFSPSAFTPNGSAVQDTVTVTSTATTLNLMPSLWQRETPAAMCGLLLLFFPTRNRRIGRGLLGCLFAGLILLPLSGCSSGTSGNSGGGSSPVTSVVTVTATSGSLQHTTTFTLTVQ